MKVGILQSNSADFKSNDRVITLSIYEYAILEAALCDYDAKYTTSTMDLAYQMLSTMIDVRGTNKKKLVPQWTNIDLHDEHPDKES